MKILEINKYNYAKGGADRHFLDVCALLESAGHSVVIFSMENSKNIFSPWQKYFVSYVGYNEKDSTFWQKVKGLFRLFYSFEAKSKIKKILADFQPEVVHFHNIYHQLSFSFIKEIKQKNIPLVMTVHDYALISPDHDEYLEAVGKQYWKFIFLSKKFFLFKRIILVLKCYFEDFIGWKGAVDVFISPSQFVAEKLVKAGIAKDKIVIIPHFILNTNSNEHVEQKENNNALERYAFYFGRISKEKGVLEMLDMFRRMGKIKLFLAGELAEDIEIISDEQVVYLGYLNKKQLKMYMEKADFCVSFSHLPETFGLIALESISRGKPFFGLNSGAFAEIIEWGGTGFICEDIFELETKIREMVEGKISFSKEMIIKRAYERFGQEKYLGKLMDLFESIISH
jgi:glycosyltransferase involved in cell wall biosynthesis